jgi:hypothetical protein
MSEKKLWTAVLTQAIVDVENPRKSDELTADEIRDEALEFLLTHDSDFAFSVAELDATAARERLEKKYAQFLVL